MVIMGRQLSRHLLADFFGISQILAVNFTANHRKSINLDRHPAPDYHISEDDNFRNIFILLRLTARYYRCIINKTTITIIVLQFIII